MIRLRLNAGRHRRAGMSMTEMMVTVSIFTVIGLTVTYLLVVAARTGHDSSEFLRTESHVRLVVDNIRRDTLVGEFLSAQVSDNGRTLRYYDPVTETNSRLQFSGNTLRFHRNVDDGAVTKRFSGLSDVRFILHENGSILEFEVVANANDADRRSRPIAIRDRVFLRNSPAI